MSPAASSLLPDPVLVTGAMGQVGQLVTALLLDRGRAVIALDLPTPGAQSGAQALMRHAAGSPGDLIPVFVDITDPSTVERVVVQHRPDCVVHLASVIPPGCYRNPEGAWRVNVEGTRNLVAAALVLDPAPVFLLASSSAVYGSRNPHRHTDRLTGDTPARPVDCYGATKVAAEEVVSTSDLRHAVLRLGGIMSPHQMANGGVEYLVVVRATPGDNRVHMVDARDVAVAFANAVDRIDAVEGKVLTIGGNETCVSTQSGVQDDTFEALGLGRLGGALNLPGDPADDDGWGLTDWFDTVESQRLLEYQEHDWDETLAWLADSLGRRRAAVRAVGPVARPVLRTLASLQRRWERRGPYADPWALIRAKFGSGALAGPTAGR